MWLIIIKKLAAATQSPAFVKYAGAAVIILIVIVAAAQRFEIGKLRNDLAHAKPDTVLVTNVHKDTVTVSTSYTSDTVTIWTKTIVRDTVFQTTTQSIIDTITIKERGVLSFKDTKNRLVDLEGSIDYPDGKRMQLIYREKQFWNLQKSWGVFMDAGFVQDKSTLGLSGYYRKISLGFSYGSQGLWTAKIGVRLL